MVAVVVAMGFVGGFTVAILGGALYVLARHDEPIVEQVREQVRAAFGLIDL